MNILQMPGVLHGKLNDLEIIAIIFPRKGQKCVCFDRWFVHIIKQQREGFKRAMENAVGWFPVPREGLNSPQSS